MVQFVAEIEIEGALRLSDTERPLVIDVAQPKARMELTNIDQPQNKDSVLLAHLTYESENIETAKEEINKLVPRFLNTLSFVTNSNFGPFRPIKIIDWTPGLAMRRASYFVHQPMREHAEPSLNQSYCDSTVRLIEMQSDEKLQRALRWFRLGLGSNLLEEQFMYFWMSLEIAAEMIKGAEKVRSHCPKCQSPLFCESCGTHPEQFASGNRAIRRFIVEEMNMVGAGEIEKTLIKIRNTLAHGRRISSIKNLPCTDEQALDRLHQIAWHALMQASSSDRDPRPNTLMDLGAPDTVVSKHVTAVAHVEIGLPNGEGGVPDMRQPDGVKLSLIRS